MDVIRHKHNFRDFVYSGERVPKGGWVRGQNNKILSLTLWQVSSETLPIVSTFRRSPRHIVGFGDLDLHSRSQWCSNFRNESCIFLVNRVWLQTFSSGVYIGNIMHNILFLTVAWILKEVVSADMDLAKTLMQTYMASDDLGYTFHVYASAAMTPRFIFHFMSQQNICSFCL